jgi:hypothetical protein
VERLRHTRKAIRFPLEAPIVFWWTESGIQKRSEGRTRDVSEMGTFVVASTSPAAGTQIGFKIFLPLLPGFQHKTRMEAVGQVLRVEQAGGCGGFAVLTHHMLMRVNNDIHVRKESGVTESQLN